MTGFNDNHRRRLMTTFRHLDESLGDAYARLQPVANGGLFAPVMADATPVQRRIVGDYLERFRYLMRRFMIRHDFVVEAPRIGAQWAFRTALAFARTSLAEVRPDRLQGYGHLGAESAAEVDALLADLDGVIGQIEAYLAAGEGGDLTTRLARLDATADEVRLLHELARIVDDHGLVEFRATLGWLLERMEHGRLEVAFFGRVSSGKSSLLNFVLEAPVLPSGVTPVTAVPIRILTGDAPGADVGFAAADPVAIPAAQLAQYASEERNPGNAKGVTEITVTWPARRLGTGVCLIDTPGLGALATAGAAQTLAYLPRCDLGVLLIDAGGTLTEEELAVTAAVIGAGAELLPVLSKADLLVEADRDKVLRYVGSHLAELDPAASAVMPVSVTPGHEALARYWVDEILAPRLTRHRELAAASLRRKIGALREAVIAALDVLAGGVAAPGDVSALAPVRAALEEAQRAAVDLTLRVRRAAPALLDAAAGALAGAEAAHGAREAVGLSLARAADAQSHALDDLLADVLQRAADALGQVRGNASDVSLPHPAGRPLFDAAAALSRHPAVPGRRGVLNTRRTRRAALERELGPVLAQVLDNHADALKHWALDYLAALTTAFDAVAAAYEAPGRLSPAPHGGARERIRADLARLRDWGAPR